MNITNVNILSAIELLEGTGFTQKHLARERNFLFTQVEEARMALVDWQIKNKADTSHDETSLAEALSDKSSACYMINGHGGWNRYAVRGDGTVQLSRHHATPKDKILLMAQEIHFPTY